MSGEELFGILATIIASRSNRNAPFLIAVDGVDGAGKTHFADRLASRLNEQDPDLSVIRASVDRFHNRRDVRYLRGATSPLGFYLDSYNYTALIRLLLLPLRSGSGSYQREYFDHQRDALLPTIGEKVTAGSLLIFDGIFLQRSELRPFWDLTIYLDVPFTETFRRMSGRDNCDPDPEAESNRRYVGGQKIYHVECSPRERADIVIDNVDYTSPRVVEKNID